MYARAWLAEERPLLLFDFATAWLVQHKVLLPGASVLERLVARAMNRANERIWQALASFPDEPQVQRLNALLDVESGQRISKLEWLRREERWASSRLLILFVYFRLFPFRQDLNGLMTR